MQPRKAVSSKRHSRDSCVCLWQRGREATWSEKRNQVLTDVLGSTYRENVTKEEMARACMYNYDPDFDAIARPGDIVVSGYNFGTGVCFLCSLLCLFPSSFARHTS